MPGARSHGPNPPERGAYGIHTIGWKAGEEDHRPRRVTSTHARWMGSDGDAGTETVSYEKEVHARGRGLKTTTGTERVCPERRTGARMALDGSERI